MEIKAKDFPLILFAFFGIISPYFLGLYLFDKKEFLSLDLWNRILLSAAYSFPVIYMNLIMEKFSNILKKDGSILKHYDSDIINVCIYSAQQQYVILIVCLIFFLDDSLFRFFHYRNATWILSFIGFIFSGIRVIIKEWDTIKMNYLFTIPTQNGRGKEEKNKSL